MDMHAHKNTAVFGSSFRMPGNNEIWPAGEYEFEAEFCAPWACVHSDAWKASVVVHLHPRTTPSGLTRSLKVSLAYLDDAIAYEKESGKRLFEFVLEETLAEPIVRLMMRADSVSEADLRQLYPDPHRSVRLDAVTDGSTQGRRTATSEKRDYDE